MSTDNGIMLRPMVAMNRCDSCTTRNCEMIGSLALEEL
jgi:hypothetical protein